ncbi:hypothetical protein O0L34_g14266 [Tuta absoluta]|nr:hypothetical protein O0L34_g14266 [Tuta absoluta]
MQENIFNEIPVRMPEYHCEESPLRMEETICEELYSQLGSVLDNTDEPIRDVSMETSASCKFDVSNKITTNNNDPTLRSAQPMQLDLSCDCKFLEDSQMISPNGSEFANINVQTTTKFPRPVVTNELTCFEILDISLKSPERKKSSLSTNEHNDDLGIIKTKDYDPNLNVAAPPPSAKFDEVIFSPVPRTPATYTNSTRNNSPLPNLFSDLDSPISFEKQIKSIATMDPDIFAETPMPSDESDFGDVVQEVKNKNKNSTLNYSFLSNLYSDLDSPISFEKQIISIATNNHEIDTETPMPSDVSDFGGNFVQKTKKDNKKKYSIKRFLKEQKKLSEQT